MDLANNVKEPVIYPMINFKWKRMIIEDSDDRIAIRFMGTNYTTKDETFLKGQINLTVSIIIQLTYLCTRCKTTIHRFSVQVADP